MKRKIFIIISLSCLFIFFTYCLINYKDIKFKYFINEKNAQSLIEEKLSDKYNEKIKILSINISKEYYNWFDSEDETLVFEGTACNINNKDNIFNYKVEEGRPFVLDNYKEHIYSYEIENILKKELVLLDTDFIDSYTYNIEYSMAGTNVTSLETYMLRNIFSIDIVVTINENPTLEKYSKLIYNLHKNIQNTISKNIRLEIKTRKNTQILPDNYCSIIHIDYNDDLETISKRLAKCFD